MRKSYDNNLVFDIEKDCIFKLIFWPVFDLKFSISVFVNQFLTAYTKTILIITEKGFCSMLKFTDIKYLEYESWFELWYTDKKSIYQTMVKNCLSDIKAGYNIHGNCIINQWRAIADYAKSINDTLDMFTEFNNSEKINRWCYHDLLKRGVIE